MTQAYLPVSRRLRIGSVVGSFARFLCVDSVASLRIFKWVDFDIVCQVVYLVRFWRYNVERRVFGSVEAIIDVILTWCFEWSCFT